MGFVVALINKNVSFICLFGYMTLFDKCEVTPMVADYKCKDRNFF